MRKTTLKRKTKETNISISLNIDGQGKLSVSTGIRFFDHMLDCLGMQAGFDMRLKAQGDLTVDQHHTVEDCGIALGMAIRKAMGRPRGINRAGYFCFPMDDALSIVAIDISGRCYLAYSARILGKRIGDLEANLIPQFFRSLAQSLSANIHIKLAYGKNAHHQVESIFKAVGKSLRMALSKDRRLKRIFPSTKRLLE